ncbi:hypothetical protein SAMN05444422_10625 [Halobiforma haloterrestris]|uniref:Uncharacterized protein n=1 Tax=Natronobacterium haloterrestre TaxID=148448 RepID=A0A1I1HQG2_NATHA|nr:hypothetical protein [Halobiforma haloterrestris]SFC24198.1 hypothetical protein SAMN05444422_10625 [Halobiforma haloterrestris]
MRQHDAEQLKEELKWAKEAAVIAEAQQNGFFGSKMLEAQTEQIPAEYQHLTDIDPQTLEQRIERLERDLQHAKQGDWDDD